MTASETTEMRESRTAELDRLAADAWHNIKSGQQWTHWRYLAQAFAAGREQAMREARTNDPYGPPYNKAFGRWMDDPVRRQWANDKVKGAVDKATRNHLLWCADHMSEIEAWRDTLAQNQRLLWNHPTTVKRQYERAHREVVTREKGEDVMSPAAKMKAALVEATEDAARWKRRAEEGGSLFDVRRDTPQQIARALVENCTASRCEAIAKAIRDEVKRQKQAHAG